MYIGMMETKSLKVLPKSLHENYSYLFKKQHGMHFDVWLTVSSNSLCWISYGALWKIFESSRSNTHVTFKMISHTIFTIKVLFVIHELKQLVQKLSSIFVKFNDEKQRDSTRKENITDKVRLIRPLLYRGVVLGCFFCGPIWILLSRRPDIACANCKCHEAQQYLTRKSRPQMLGMVHRQTSTEQRINCFA